MLEEAERVLERLVIAREVVAEVLAEPAAEAADPMEDEAGSAAVAGSTVPHRREGVTGTALAPDYQRIMSVLAAEKTAGRGGMRAKELAAALGLELVPAKIEGVRCRAKRLVEWGWIGQHPPGAFGILTP
ncbi:hypothetical protein ABZS81_29565 [Streptomyces sp. NPDC005318]|uniref:hypothetical protein n=1 Tax=Streptomyces sp. NPDC005318 TaxID=3157031 RepID=UPI0033BC00E0